MLARPIYTKKAKDRVMAKSMTISLRQIYRCQVLNQKAELIGTVDDVLFHPSLPKAVGFSIKPYRVGGIIALPMKYLLFENASFNENGQLVVIFEGKIPQTEKEQKAARSAWNDRAEKKLGFSWEESVIYYGQNVYTLKGTLLGKVSDARFDISTGDISVLQVTAGTSADALLGKRSIPADMVKGFNHDAYGILCDNAAEAIEFDGGAAEQAGKAAAAATEAGKKIGEATIKGAAKAAVYGERALKQASQTKAGKTTKKWFSTFVKDFKDAMDDEE